MDQLDMHYREMRDIWTDYNHRQEFEHTLIDRKTTWLLTTQAILFAAYGLTFDGTITDEALEIFRVVVGFTGLSIAVIILVGVLALIESKHLSWEIYRDFYNGSGNPDLPKPLDRHSLQWGVETRNTHRALLPDLWIPVLFIAAWVTVLISGFAL